MTTNGYPAAPVLAGAAFPDRPARPVVGPRAARVAYPLDAPPTITGPYGRAWRCDLDAARRKMLVSGSLVPDATVAHWIIEAPWSDEVVHSYSLVVASLRFSLDHQPVTRYLEGATHEVSLWAIHPAAPRADMLAGPINPTMWLAPLSFASQIAEPTSEAAAERAARAADLVCQGRLSPHPEHARSWAELFGDCMLRRAEAPAAGDAEEDRDGRES